MDHRAPFYRRPVVPPDYELGDRMYENYIEHLQKKRWHEDCTDPEPDFPKQRAYELRKQSERNATTKQQQ